MQSGSWSVSGSIPIFLRKGPKKDSPKGGQIYWKQYIRPPFGSFRILSTPIPIPTPTPMKMGNDLTQPDGPPDRVFIIIYELMFICHIDGIPLPWMP